MLDHLSTVQALAAIGASATADQGQLGVKKGSPISELEKKQKKAEEANKRVKKKKR